MPRQTANIPWKDFLVSTAGDDAQRPRTSQNTNQTRLTAPWWRGGAARYTTPQIMKSGCCGDRIPQLLELNNFT